MASSSRDKSQNKRKPPSQSTLKLELVTTSPAKRLKPLGAFAKPPVFNLSGSQSKLSQSSQGDVKGKGKAAVQPKPKFEVVEEVGHESDGLWVDMYGPTTEAELAVHVRKVNDVRQWLLEAFEGGPSGKLRKYRKLLVLTGPAGTGKTTTLRVLSRELGFEILEWKNTADERFYGREDFDSDERGNRIEYEGLSDKFHAFLSRAITTTNSTSVLSSSSSTSHSQSQAHPSRRIVLLEDLPNILHPPTRASFHASLHTAIRATPSLSKAPIVIVVSDAGVRGESDEGNISSWKGKGREVVDIRTVLPPDLLHSPYVTQISFNPIAPTLMKRALQNLLSSHLRLKGLKPPSKELLDLIVETSNGDIRSAVMALQFACTSSSASASSSNVPSKSIGKGRSKKEAKGGKGREESARWVEVMSRREQSLVLFHLLGKVLYNKRKGDAPSASASARDIARERALDMRLKDPPPLPEWLAGHERRASRVDVEALYADTPIDASLLSLYIHQNYTQYCSPASLEECEGVMEWLSWVDSSGGESWQQTNPHQFHLLTLGTLHALPSPVPRLGQKPYKPAFFDNLKATREAQDGVGDVLWWLRRQEGAGTGWTRREVALEMGGILKAFDVSGSGQSRSNWFNGRPPASHRTFSRLEFSKGSTSITDIVDDTTTGLGEEEGEGGEEGEEDEKRDPEKAAGGWLESDDIEDW